MDMKQLVGDSFRGCGLVTRNQQILGSIAAGCADLPNQIPNTLDTKFATASAGKVFVAVGILQLIEKGLLRFEDALGDLVRFDLHAIDPQVTVEQLLTHTAGVPDYFDESVMEEYEALWANYPNYRVRSNADLLPLFIEKPMLYPRGQRFQYNNTGYVLLGMILEAVTAAPFDVCLKANVFDLCGMAHTGYYELDRLPAKCANSYIYDPQRGEYRTNIYSVDAKGTGAGGAFTTVGDIARFWSALHSGRLLSQEMTGNMLRCHSGNEKDGYYGYGVWLKKGADDTFSPYFQGCDPGVSFVSAYDDRTNTTATLVSNYGDNVWRIMRQLRAALFG